MIYYAWFCCGDSAAALAEMISKKDFRMKISRCMCAVCIALAAAIPVITVSEAGCDGHAICQSLPPELPDAPEQDHVPVPTANVMSLAPMTASPTGSITFAPGKIV